MGMQRRLSGVPSRCALRYSPFGRPGGLMAWPAAVLALLWLLAACGTRTEPGFAITRDDPHVVWRAELAIVDSERPPPDAAAWQLVELPDTWRRTERWKSGAEGWYRIRLAGPAPAEPTSVYLWRFSMNAAVWFNGTFLGDGGSFEEPVARSWNRPLLFALPAALWRNDGAPNLLHVRLHTYPGYGHLMPVAVGPTALLKPEHERRQFMQVTLSEVAAGVTLLALLTGAILWTVDRREAAMPWFAAFCLGWLVYGANNWVRDIPVPAKAWLWLVHSSADASFALAAGCFHRLLGMRRPRVEALLLGWTIVCALLYAAWSLPQLERWSAVTHGIASLGGLYLCVWLVRRWLERRTPERLVFALAFVAVFGAGLFDQLLNALLLPELWRSGFFLTHLVMPLMFLALIAMLALRAARGLRAERAAADERERIYRDLHDNLGARLLSLVYSARDERQATLARDALAEMRSLISSGPPQGGRLGELATDWRVECELRCEDAGVALRWQQQGDALLSAGQRLQLERILRELVSNALEHAQAKSIEVTLDAGAAALDATVADDGRGMDADATHHGHGLRSVRERAQQVGGQVQWQPRAGGGTECSVHLPLAARGKAGT